MALGYYLSEEVLFAADGTQLSLGTWQYKPPAVADIPLEFNVSFVPKTPNQSPNNVLGSKASAEPPMALGAAAFFAAREAIRAVRADGGVSSPFACEAPLTVERIQQACHGRDMAEVWPRWSRDPAAHGGAHPAQACLVTPDQFKLR